MRGQRKTEVFNRCVVHGIVSHMKEQRVLISESDTSVNLLIESGWQVVKVIATHHSFCFVLERIRFVESSEATIDTQLGPEI